MPALTDALKLAVLAKKFETHSIGVIVNRVSGDSHELSLKNIENFLDVPIIGYVPEDKAVKKSIAFKQPVVIHNPKSMAARNFKAIASKLVGEKYRSELPLFVRLLSWLR